MMHNAPQVLVRYTLLEAHSATKLRLNPLLAFRDIHSLSKQNPVASTQPEAADNGIRARLYPEFPYLYMQFSKKVDFINNAYWNNSKTLEKNFNKYLKERSERNSAQECLQYSAAQFLIHKAGETRIKAGYHWFDSNTRDTFISLPGIALSGNTAKIFDEVLTSACKYFYEGLFGHQSCV